MRFILPLFLATACQGWSPSLRLARSLTRATSLQSSANDVNVVLRPSEDPEAFDSFRIGSARVHRYIRDSLGPEEEAKYVMWYHGRPGNFDEEKELPPLTTGRIGRATSNNGLHWEKTTEGSLAEDAPDVTLGLNKESWWGFDTAHVGLGQVLLPMSTPAVMTEGGVYLMYYMGGSYDETPVASYLRDVPEASASAKIKGMKLKIGVALSQDGITWGRVEGDDPSGACMAPYEKSDPNMKYIAGMRDDDDSLLNIEEELYCGWPEVVVQIIDEKASQKVAGKTPPAFFMYYSTMTKDTKEKCIACAVSADGFRWLKRGVVVRPDESGLDEAGCARSNVIKKASYNEETGVWTDEKGFIMYYEGVSKKDNNHRVMAAESDDGRTWKKLGVAFDVGGDGAWDCAGVGSPHVLRLDDGSLRMYYTGQGTDGSTAIGVAKCAPEDHVGGWTREQAQFTFA
mmetsp:Transcript_9894/g.15226  ORF Transcript_9894/g.15226 Transcript_9894/m.15226 type:complete len:456 (-) Transcript_9894:51-1418(-)